MYFFLISKVTEVTNEHQKWSKISKSSFKSYFPPKLQEKPRPELEVNPSINNKDHQRMMVDPMFKIIQNLRSFLTAVTTTAVAPIAVILPEFT